MTVDEQQQGQKEDNREEQKRPTERMKKDDRVDKEG